MFFPHRFNKIGLNNKDGRMIDECSHLVPFKLQPLSDLCVKEVAFGLFHTAFLTGLSNFVCKVLFRCLIVYLFASTHIIFRWVCIL